MMESEVTGNCHASFGERDRETRKSKGLKVRSVPTLLSPLLANVALHGMENRLKQFAESLPGKKQANSKALTFVRYADDFVVLHPDRRIIEKAKNILTDWLTKIGLEISEAKTKLTHTSEGFDFGDMAYWASRLGKHPELSNRVSKLLKVQKGKCNHCGLTFRDGDIWEVDHITPRNQGGKDVYNNLQLSRWVGKFITM